LFYLEGKLNILANAFSWLNKRWRWQFVGAGGRGVDGLGELSFVVVVDSDDFLAKRCGGLEFDPVLSARGPWCPVEDIEAESDAREVELFKD